MRLLWCSGRSVEVWANRMNSPMGSSTCWQQTTTESEDIVSGVFDTDCDLAMCQYLANSREYILVSVARNNGRMQSGVDAAAARVISICLPTGYWPVSSFYMNLLFATWTDHG